MSTATALAAVRADARRCRNCPLWQHATQTVFGEGPAAAKVMLVGEQPGDKEDLDGRPFVGPAGKLLRQALAEAGVDPDALYFTNAVKHFSYAMRGKRRLHKTPAQRDIEACRGWLIEELALVRPRLVVALGATALRSLLHKKLPVLRNRGQLLDFDAAAADMAALADAPLRCRVLVTVHPSSILRVPSPDRDAAYRDFVRDLAAIHTALKPAGRRRAPSRSAAAIAPAPPR